MDKIQTLIKTYEERRRSAIYLREDTKNSIELRRLTTKIGCYTIFIEELEEILSEQLQLFN